MVFDFQLCAETTIGNIANTNAKTFILFISFLLSTFYYYAFVL